jgi:hypothetical protein
MKSMAPQTEQAKKERARVRPSKMKRMAKRAGQRASQLTRHHNSRRFRSDRSPARAIPQKKRSPQNMERRTEQRALRSEKPSHSVEPDARAYGTRELHLSWRTHMVASLLARHVDTTTQRLSFAPSSFQVPNVAHLRNFGQLTSMLVTWFWLVNVVFLVAASTAPRRFENI